MPLPRIDLIKGKPAEYRQTIGDVVYTAISGRRGEVSRRSLP